MNGLRGRAAPFEAFARSASISLGSGPMRCQKHGKVAPPGRYCALNSPPRLYVVKRPGIGPCVCLYVSVCILPLEFARDVSTRELTLGSSWRHSPL